MEFFTQNPEITVALIVGAFGVIDVLVGKYVPVAYKGTVNTVTAKVADSLKAKFQKKPITKSD